MKLFLFLFIGMYQLTFAGDIIVPPYSVVVTRQGNGLGSDIDSSGILGDTTLTFTPDPGQCVSPMDTFLTVINCAPPPCPSAGEDITMSFCPISLTQNNFIIYLNADPGGTWDPPFNDLANPYIPCINGDGPITYTQDNPGCPIEQATITFDWIWWPCEWQPEGLCLTGDEGSFTIPAFEGDHPGSTYTINSNCVTIMPMTGSLDESTVFTFSWNGWCSTTGCINLWINVNEFPFCEYYFGEPDPVNGDWLLCDLPLCNCVDPPYAGEDTLITVCSEVPPYDLTTSLGGDPDPGGHWIPELNSGNNIYDPNVDGTGTYIYTVSSPFCSDAQAAITINVQLILPAIISGVPSSICEADPPIVLPTVQNGITGNWSGADVSNNIFDPMGLDGTITITFNPDPNQCTSPASTTIDVHPFAVISLAGIPDSLCQSALPVSLPTLQTGINGHWSGTGVTNNVFNPNGLSGNIVLTFSPNVNECADPAAVTIHVSLATTPVIIGVPDTLCQADLPVNLPPTLNGITGNWTGNGILNNTFNPSGLSGSIPITFTVNLNQCANNASSNIQVNALVIPLITGVPGSLCNFSPPVVLNTLQNGITGNWTGTGVINNEFTPTGLNGNVIITFSPDQGQCAASTATSITVNTLPSFQNLLTICDSLANSYSVSFDISGGLPGTYTVNGMPLAGSHFSSIPMDDDSIFYQFSLDDQNGCGPVNISGINNCACATYAGTMNFNSAPLIICVSSQINVIHNGDQNLDADDLLGFVIHDNAGTQLGFVYSLSSTTTFSVPPGIVLGQTYFISSIAGSNNGLGNIDLLDDCLSVSQGIPIVFYQPGATISQGGSICPTDCFIYHVLLTGAKPFVLEYNVLANGMTFPKMMTKDTNWADLLICPSDFGIISGNMDLVLISLADVNCNISLSPTSGTAIIVHPDVITHFNRLFCDGESVIINNTLYDQSHASGTEIFPNGSVFGCDSLVNISLSFYPPVVFDLNQTLCFGNSLTVNGTVYDELNPAGTETILNGSEHGCDSIINIHLEFDSIVTAELSLTLCSGETAVINGTTYNENHPAGSELFINGSVLGCDSLLNIDVSFNPPSSFELKDTLCKGENLIVNGIVYDYLNPTGTEILSHGSISGCDSMVSVNLNFYPDAMITIDDTLDKGETLVINGTTYDQMNPSGTELILMGSIHGCDSVIVVNLHFNAIVLTVDFEVKQPVCYGEYATIQLNSIFGGIHSYWVHVDQFPDVPVDHFPYIIGDFYEGFHFLVIQDAEGLVEKYEVLFEVHEIPPLLVDAGPDQSLLQNQDAILQAQASLSNVMWNWWPPDFLTCTDCPNPLVLQPIHNILYTVEVTDQNGCTATDVISIKVDTEYDIYFPNVFSPNGDGVNDIVYLNSHANIRIIKSIQIFDRWGGVLFQQKNFLPNDLKYGWDGTSDGKDLNPGVYVWMAEVEFEDGNTKMFSAEVTLMR